MTARIGIGLLLAAGVVAVPAPAERVVMLQQGQVFIENWGDPFMEGGLDASRSEGFSVAAGATEIQDTSAPALFTAMQQEDWVAVVRLLETLGNDNAQALIRDPSGMLRPLSTLRRQVLAELPAEGRRAFRTMYGPVANKLYEDALSLADPVRQRAMLIELVEGYALCAPAARGADRLGDLSFEQGRFGEAARYYALAADHPDARPDDAGLMAKRLHTMARGGDWSAFDALAEYARFRRGDASVRVGGEDTPLRGVIESLAAQRPEGGDAPAVAGRALAFPRGHYPSMQIDLIDERQLFTVQQAIGNRGIVMPAAEMVRPEVVAADGRVYALWLGELAAINPGTGEMLWTRGNAEDMLNRIAQQSHQLVSGYYQSLTVRDDKLLVTAHDPDQLDLVRLSVRDKATGDAVWTSQAGDLTNLSFIGRPAVRGGVLYSVTQQRGTNNLALTAVMLRDGALAWSVDLGQAAMDPNWGQTLEVAPRIAVGERYVMALTNNGALIAIDPIQREIAWAMTYGVLPSAMGNRGRGFVATSPGATGDVAMQSGIVLSKDTRDDRLYAIRERDAVRLWSARIDPGATIVHADERHAYLLGDELVALDLQTGERVWWTSHHGDAGTAPAFTDTHALVAGPRRMCRIDLTTGKVDGYREDIPAGPSGSPTILLNGGVLVVGPTGLRVYDTNEEAD